MNMPRIAWVLCGCLTVAADAAVYRCDVEGRVVYTDTPCKAEAEPLEVRTPSSIAPVQGGDLARDYDERIGAERAQRDEASARWLEGYQDNKAEAERIRAARVDGRVVPGMTPADVKLAWGMPDAVENPDAERERWVYRRDRTRKVVTFRDGRVAGLSGAANKPQGLPGDR